MKASAMQFRAIGCLLAFISSASLLPAQDDTETDAETERLLAEIASTKEVLLDGTSKNNERALSACNAALGSTKATYEFYMAARKQLEFDDAGKRESDWRDWRDQNEERYKSAEHIAALQLQLRYLVLTIRAASGDDEFETLKALGSDLMKYLNALSSGYEKVGEHADRLQGSVLDSPIAERLKLNLTAGSSSHWCFSPSDVAGIYDKTILPVIRESGNFSALQSAWDNRMKHEAAMYVARGLVDAARAGPGGGGARFRGRTDAREREREERREGTRLKGEGEETFRDIRLPQLKWGKARDALFYGSSRITALRAMNSHVKANLDHPSAKTWIDELESLAKQQTYDAAAFYSPAAAK